MSKRHKVVIDIYSFKYSISGIGTYVSELISALQDFEEIELITVPYSYELVIKNTGASSMWRKILNHLNYYFWKSFKLPRYVRALQPCTLIVPDFVLPKDEFQSVQKVAIIHDDLFWEYPENYNPIWRRWFIGLINKGLTPQSKIITTSKFSKYKLDQLFDNQVDYVYQTYKSFKTSEAKGVESDFEEQSRYILHVGTFDKRKDLMTLVQALNALKSKNFAKDLRCVFVGEQQPNGNSDVFNELQSYIIQNHLEGLIIFKGYVSKDELRCLYENAYCYVFPSKYEGFGIPILESFFFNVPVITSNAEALVEIGGDGTIKFEIGDYEGLAKKIELLLTNDDLYHSLIEKGNRRLKDFDSKLFARKIIELISRYNAG